MGQFIREDFIAFLAPPKRGKTWWLMYLATVASLAGLKVLFISLEMSQNQMVRRFWQSIQGSSQHGEVAPWTIFEENGDKFSMFTEERPTKRVDSSVESIEKLQNSIKKASRGGELRLENYPTSSFSIKDLRTRLVNLELYDGVKPDVVILDYADIMDHGPGGGNEERHKLNKTWTALRGIASEFKIALFTASQAGRKAVSGKKDADDDDIAEDIRKLGHVTKLIKINQTKEERARGIYRLSCDLQREGSTVADFAWVTSCLAIGRPWLDAKLGSKVTQDVS